MRLKALKTGLVVFGLLAFPSAFAQDDKPKKDPEKVFAKMDLDSDGFLSKEEFIKATEGRKKKNGEPVDPEKAFAHLDKNKDGLIDLEEFKSKPPRPPKPPRK